MVILLWAWAADPLVKEREGGATQKGEGRGTREPVVDRLVYRFSA